MGGKVCVVTGASSGIGATAASSLAKDGFSVVAAARREDRLAEVVGSLPGSGHSYVVTDVASRDAVRELVQHVESRHGRLDVLINNAGFSRRGGFRGADSIEDVRAMVDVNFMGAVNCTGEFLHLLEASAPSTVVNVASIAGRVALGNSSGYSATKFALVGWSEGLRFELAPRGIHVGLVEPGPIPTEGFPQSDLRGHPVLRHVIGTTDDVAEAIKDVIYKRSKRRSVPRLYRVAQLPQHVVPSLHRMAMRAFVNRRA